MNIKELLAGKLEQAQAALDGLAHNVELNNEVEKAKKALASLVEKVDVEGAKQGLLEFIDSVKAEPVLEAVWEFISDAEEKLGLAERACSFDFACEELDEGGWKVHTYKSDEEVRINCSRGDELMIASVAFIASVSDQSPEISCACSLSDSAILKGLSETALISFVDSIALIKLSYSNGGEVVTDMPDDAALLSKLIFSNIAINVAFEGPDDYKPNAPDEMYSGFAVVDDGGVGSNFADKVLA